MMPTSRCAGLLFAAVLSSCTSSAGPSPGTGGDVLVLGSKGTRPGRFQFPRAVAVAPATGQIYVVDRSGRIQLFAPDGALLREWRLPESQLGQPVGLAVEADGSLLVNDSHYHRILRYRPDGSEILAQWGSEGKGPGQLTFGRDVVVDAVGNVYAGDYGGLNDRILKFARDGRFLLEWGSVGEGPGQFQRPQGMAIERRAGLEHVLVADSCNHRLQRFTLEGQWVASIGSLGTGPGELRYPYSVAIGGDGSLFVAEWGNNRIQRLDREGRPLGTWGGPGHDRGELATPWDIAIGPDGRIFVADYGNHRVQIFRWPAAVADRLTPGSSASTLGM
jgi:DNA-binding beta-propeller fold protein YncE